MADASTTARVEWWVSGGWGIDALVGEQLRDHIDIDIWVPATEETAALEALAGLGFEISQDWRPTRVLVTTADGRGVDIHPCVRRDGAWVLAGIDGEEYVVGDDDLTDGSIRGRSVRCISAEKQLEFHTGYERSAQDEADLAALRAAGLLPVEST